MTQPPCPGTLGTYPHCQANATFLVAGGLRTIVTTDAHYIQLQGCGQTLMTKQPML